MDAQVLQERHQVQGHDKLKAIRPDWFLSQTQIAAKKKEELLRMARNGEPRPSYDKTKFGQALSNYTRKSSEAYDPVFDKQIRKLRPDWFNHERPRIPTRRRKTR